jgi:predicted kinase
MQNLGKVMTIMVGRPGSGKSTVKDALVQSTLAKASESIEDLIAFDAPVVCSADNYFTHGGEYHFDASQLGEAHASCMWHAVEAASHGVPLIVIDNCNMTNVERAPYYLLAQAYGYKVHMLFVGFDLTDEECAARNTHGVPLHVIQNMSKRFENPIPYWACQSKHINGK